MNTLPTLATLWVSGELGWVERLCLQSMLDQGHDVTLYSYGEVGNIPDGVSRRDARAIWTPPKELMKKTAPSFIADIFRIHLMHKTEEIWVDTDILCIRPLFVDSDGYLIGYTPWHAEVNNAVMRMPRTSPALALLRAFVEDDTRVPTWIRPALRLRIERYTGSDRLAFLYQTKRTILGPRALTYCLTETGEIKHAAEPDVLSPVPWQFVQVLFNPFGGTDGWVTADTLAIHLWSFVLGPHRKMPLHPNCYIGQKMSGMGLSDLTDTLI